MISPSLTGYDDEIIMKIKDGTDFMGKWENVDLLNKNEKI